MVATFFSALHDTFAKHAGRRAIVHQHRDITYADLAIHAREGAGWLQSLGVKRRDCVALLTPNKLAFVRAHLATVAAGAVTLPLNPRFTREELRFFLEDSGARVAVVSDEVRPIVESLRADLPKLHTVIPDATILDSPKSTYRTVPVDDNDPCLIIYSSGTTGWPKGVVHTHGNAAAALAALGKCWSFTPNDIVLNVLPLFHVHGLSFALQLPLLTGACVLLDEFEPQHTMVSVRDCTVFMAVPTIYYRLLEQPNFRAMAKGWTRTRLFTCGSAPIRAEVLPELEAILGKPVLNRYGMTEAFVITSLPLDGPWPYGSVGKPLDGVEVRVLSEPSASAGGVGPVQIRGPNLFREYWNKPDATRAAFADGWFDTGDLGSLDANGFLTLVGRKNDLIITSGFNVYPQVVERVINDCPGVRESAVVGVPDDRKGERVVAVIVRADAALDEVRLQSFLSDRLIDYQRPKKIVFVDALPRNTMGKVLRRELRDRVMGEKP